MIRDFFLSAREELCFPICHISWETHYTLEQQKDGRLALQELLRRLNCKRITKRIPCHPMTDHDYLHNLNEARKALDAQNYCFACHELLNVLYLNCSAQTIHIVRRLIRPYLEDTQYAEALSKNKEARRVPSS